MAANQAKCCRAATLPLHAATNQRMYRGLTVKFPVVSRSASRCSAGTFEIRASSVFPIPPQPAQRAADKERRFRARAASGPRLPSCSRDGFRHGMTDYPGRRPRYAMAGERFGAAPGLQRQTRRHLWPPTCLDGPTLNAPDRVAEQDSPNNRADAGRKLRTTLCFGGIRFGPAPRDAFWPSPHPRIRWTVASPGSATRAYRETRPPPSRVSKCPTKC